MAQLTNTRIYGNLNVDAITTLNGDLNANGGINVTPLENSTNTMDNSAKITLNSKIIDYEGNSASNENKLSSIKLSSENKRYGKIINSSVTSTYSQNNSRSSYAAEIKNNAGALLSLDLSKVKFEESMVSDIASGNLKIHNINIDDTLYNISVDVSAFPKASSSKPEVKYDNVDSAYTTGKTDVSTGIRGTTNTTKSTVNLQLTVPYEGGEIITDKTLDGHTIYVVNVSDTQFTKLLNSNALLDCIYDCIYEGKHGVILHAVLSSNVYGHKAAQPALFYIKDGSVHMSCFSYSSGTFEDRDSITYGEILYLVVSTKELYDELTNIIA